MKFAATAAAATVLATGVSAQVSSPLQLLQYASRLLTAECREAVTGLVTGSELSQCLQVNNLLPILNNANTSVIPNINDYLTGLCSADACNQTTIDNATETVTTACATDLSRFGISEGLVEFIMNAYPTAREVACLSTNDTSLLMANGTSMMSNASSSMNSTSNMTTFCPTALLYKAQDYLGVNLTNNYIDSLILGANATAYQEILAIPHNGSVIADFGCNDCVAAGLEIVIRDYPQLENLTFNLNASDIEEYTNYNLTGLNQTERDNTTWTVARLYEGFCDVDVLANSSLPASINSTAYNSTEESTTSSMMSSMMMSSTSGSTATGAVASATSAVRSSASSAVASATSLPAPVASATSAVASVLPVPSQVISAVGGAPSVPATPTKRWVKWE